MQTSSSSSTSTITLPPNSILYGGEKNKGAVSLADLLERRTHGLTEPETWALLCQAVQALQDLFLSDSCSVGRCVPLVTPGSFLVTPRGRVSLPTSRRLTATPPQTAYLAPEYRPGKNFTDTESEKMWIFSLGETLTRTALTNHCAVTHLTPALCRALSAMTRRNPTHRANLMCLLDVISDYCKSRTQTKPFSHIVMDLHREVMDRGAIVVCHQSPPSMPGTSSYMYSQYHHQPVSPTSSTSQTSSKSFRPSSGVLVTSGGWSGTSHCGGVGPGMAGTLPRQHSSSTLSKTPTRSTRQNYNEDYLTSHNDILVQQQRNERPTSLYNNNNSNNSLSYNDNITPNLNITNNNYNNSNNNINNKFNLTSPTKYQTQNIHTTNNNNNNTLSNQLLKFNARTLEMNRNTVTRFNNNNSNNNNNNNNINNNPFENLDTINKYWENNVVSSENNVLTEHNKRKPLQSDTNGVVKKRRNPIQRAASRLYKACDGPSTVRRNKKNFNDCIGPEFVVRASLPAKQLSVGDCKPSLQRNITVILLNGQKLNVICDPNTTTAGEIFQVVIQSENLKENFMLGLSALMSGDFIFLPSDTRVCKVATFNNNQAWSILTLFLRVRLFLPSLRGLRGYEARHALYLQLRRSILEQQLACNLKTLITIGGLALQAEFDDFKEKEHGTTDYFLLEHYVPESMLNESSSTTLKELLIQAHKDRVGCDRDRAEQEFIQHAQALPHYGGHFYAATWVTTKETQCNSNVWLCVTARGISLYERTSTSPLTSSNISPCQAFEWRSIQTLCYSKQFLCILPHSGGKHSRPTKCKLKMDHKKSYFTFRLASLHHQFFLRLRTEYSSLQTLAQEFGIPLKDVKNETNALCKMNPIASNNEDTQFKISYRTSSVSSHGSSSNSSSNHNIKQQKCRRSKSATEIRVLNDNMQLEEYQNKENENPQNKQNFGSLTRDVKKALILDSSLLSGLPNVPLFSRERRHGVLMGTRAIGSSCTFQPSDLNQVIATSEGSDIMSLHSSSQGESLTHYGSEGQVSSEAFVLNSTLRASDEKFLPDFHETISDSLMEKFDKLSFVEERILRSITLVRDNVGSLGLQITEGSDGNVYVQSVIANGPADKSKSIFKGDQIVAVDGQSLLNLCYEDALNLLKHTGKSVDFVLSQLSMSDNRHRLENKNKSKAHRNLYKSCLQLNNPTFERPKASFFNSCADISNLSPNNSFLSASAFLQNDTVVERNVDISAINYVDFSETSFYNPTKVLQHSTNIYDHKGSIYNCPIEKNYLKHIRYETAAEIDGIYGNNNVLASRLNKSPVSNQRISKSCGTLNDPKMFLHDIYSDVPKSPQEMQNAEPIVNSIVPKMSKSIENFLYHNDSVKSICVDDTISSEEDLIDKNNTDVVGKQVALPRSLGLSRKWKGPVRYPVTPIRYSTNRVASNEIEGGDTSTYFVTSDDEQVFI